MPELSEPAVRAVVALPVLVFLVLVVAYPLVYALWMSLQTDHLLRRLLRPTSSGSTTIATCCTTPTSGGRTWITIRFTAESVVLTLLIGLALALRAATGRWPLRRGCRTLVILPWAVSPYGAGHHVRLSGARPDRPRHRHRARVRSAAAPSTSSNRDVRDRGAGGRQRLEHGPAGRLLPARQHEDDPRAALRPRRDRPDDALGDASCTSRCRRCASRSSCSPASPPCCR